jgi:CDP-diacylglycerol---serine O-phosphatidyltransferase
MKLFTIPNLLTLLNLFCGCSASILLIEGPQNNEVVMLLVAVSAVADFFDGLVARWLKQASPIGKELDSLADVVSFGLVPGLIARQMLLETLPHDWTHTAWVALMIPLFSALRLAKFNVDERQHQSFIGLPTPANTLFWLGLPLLFVQMGYHALDTRVQVVVLMVLIVLSSWVLIAELPLLALKFSAFHWRGNEARWSLLISGLLLLCAVGFACLPIIVLLYLLLSMIQQKTKHEIQS